MVALRTLTVSTVVVVLIVSLVCLGLSRIQSSDQQLQRVVESLRRLEESQKHDRPASPPHVASSGSPGAFLPQQHLQKSSSVTTTSQRSIEVTGWQSITVPGSVRFVAAGVDGATFSCVLKGPPQRDCAMKTPIVNAKMTLDAGAAPTDSSCKVGQHISAEKTDWQDGEKYGAVVLSINEDTSTYSVKWDDDKGDVNVPFGEARDDAGAECEGTVGPVAEAADSGYAHLWVRRPVAENYFEIESAVRPGWVLQATEGAVPELPATLGPGLTLFERGLGGGEDNHYEHWRMEDGYIISRKHPKRVITAAQRIGLWKKGSEGRQLWQFELSTSNSDEDDTDDEEDTTVYEVMRNTDGEESMRLEVVDYASNYRWFVRESHMLQLLDKLLHLVRPSEKSPPTYYITERLGQKLSMACTSGCSDTKADWSATYLYDMKNGQAPSMSLVQAVAAMLPVARTVQQLHDNGLSFNDMHGRNVLRQSGQPVKFQLVDFGDVNDARTVTQLSWGAGASWTMRRDWKAVLFHVMSLEVHGTSLREREDDSTAAYWRLVGNGKVEEPEFEVESEFKSLVGNASNGSHPEVLELFMKIATEVMENHHVEVNISAPGNGLWTLVPVGTTGHGVQLKSTLTQECLELKDNKDAVEHILEVQMARCSDKLTQVWQVPALGQAGYILNRQRLYCVLEAAGPGRAVVRGGFPINQVQQLWHWEESHEQGVGMFKLQNGEALQVKVLQRVDQLMERLVLHSNTI